MRPHSVLIAIALLSFNACRPAANPGTVPPSVARKELPVDSHSKQINAPGDGKDRDDQERHLLAAECIDHAAARMHGGQWDAAMLLLLKAYEMAAPDNWIRQSAVNLIAGWDTKHPALIRSGPCIAVSPDGGSFIAKLADDLHVFETGTCRPTGVRVPDADFAFYSPDGKLLLACRRQGSLRLCNATTGKVNQVLGHWTGLHSPTVHFDVPTQRIVIAGIEPPRIYDLSRGIPISSTSGTEGWRLGTKFVQVDPTGRLVAQEEGAGIKLFDLSQPLAGGATTPLGSARLKLSHVALDARFLPDGKSVVTIGEGGSVCLWDIATHKRLGIFELPYSRMHYNLPTSMALSSDGKVIAVGDRRGFVEFLNAENLASLGAIAQHDAIRRVTFGPKIGTDQLSDSTPQPEDSNVIWALTESGELQCFNRFAGSNTPVFTARGGLAKVDSFFVTTNALHVIGTGREITQVWKVQDRWQPRFQTNRGRLPYGSANVGVAGIIPVVNQNWLSFVSLSNGEALGKVSLESGEGRDAVVLSTQGNLAAIVMTDGTVRLHKVPSGEQTVELAGKLRPPNRSLPVLSHDGSRLLGVSAEGWLLECTSVTGECRSIRKANDETLLAISPDATAFRSWESQGANTKVSSFELSTGAKVGELNLKGDLIGTCVDADEKLLIATAYWQANQHVILVHDLMAGRQLCHISGAALHRQHAAFSANGSSFAVTRDDGVWIYDVMTGLAVLPPRHPVALANAAAWKPYSVLLGDERTLITDTGEISVWDLPHIPVSNNQLRTWVELRTGARWIDKHCEPLSIGEWLSRWSLIDANALQNGKLEDGGK